jgi:hypothetical protein
VGGEKPADCVGGLTEPRWPVMLGSRHVAADGELPFKIERLK